MRTTSQSKGDVSRQSPNMIRACAMGIIAFFTVFAVLLMLFSLLMTMQDFSPMTMRIIGYISIALASFVGGMTVLKIARQKALMLGSICGIIFFVILSFISGIMGTKWGGNQSLIKAAICIGAAILGGFCGINRKKRRK